MAEAEETWETGYLGAETHGCQSPTADFIEHGLDLERHVGAWFLRPSGADRRMLARNNRH